MFSTTDDIRIESLRPLLPPAILMEEVTPSRDGFALVSKTRQAVNSILEGSDDRLLAIVGPCSMHDPAAGLEYAHMLKSAAEELSEDLLIIMRVYFEKPRTRIGWKGLINDPSLDNQFAINRGLRVARRLLCDLADMGVPAGSEFLDPITPQFIADLISWGAIGARTTESQVHRELASGLSMPIGFKNGTGGDTKIAVDAIHSSAHAHHFLSVTKQGLAAIVSTLGNPSCHLILRGGSQGPNYHQEGIENACESLEAAGLPGKVMVDCSHANSAKNHKNQPAVAKDLAGQILNGSQRIFGFMLESFLVEGRQDHHVGKALQHGQSITDACMNFEQTRRALDLVASAVRQRRHSKGSA